MPPILYILYNATASPLGKLNYAYRKLSSTSSNSPCSACDLTHGGLRLTETAQWSATKKRVSADVQQLHRDEAPQEILDFMKKNGVRWPCVLGREGEGGELRLVMDERALRETSADHERFLERLAGNAQGVGIRLDVASRVA